MSSGVRILVVGGEPDQRRATARRLRDEYDLAVDTVADVEAVAAFLAGDVSAVVSVDRRDRVADAVGDSGIPVVDGSGDEVPRLPGVTSDTDGDTQSGDTDGVEGDTEPYQAMVETVPDGVFTVTPEEGIGTVNEGLVSLSGYDRRALESAHPLMLLDRDGYRSLRRARRRTESAPETVETFETEVYAASGETVQCAFRVSSAGDRTVVVVRDLSDRAAREAAMRRSERQWQGIFDGSRDAMVITDDTGEYLRVNSAACDLFGLPESELVGSSTADFADPSFDLSSDWTREYDGDGRGVFRLLRRDGEVLITEYSASNVLPDRHLLVLRDVTDRTLREQRLQVLQRALRHNLRNELNVVLGAADELRSSVEDPDLKEAATAIQEASSDLLALSNTAAGSSRRWTGTPRPRRSTSLRSSTPRPTESGSSTPTPTSTSPSTGRYRSSPAGDSTRPSSNSCATPSNTTTDRNRRSGSAPTCSTTSGSN